MKSARQTGKEIRLLGELQVLDGSRALPLPPSRRARALLGYLVVTGTPHLRETLCRLFWEGPDDPRGALRWALARLRPIVDDANRSRIVTDGGRVAFDAAGAGVDLATVTRTLSPGIDKVPTGELVSSAALFRGELLEGLDLADCYRFREWCVAERERARGARVEILKELVARLADRPEDALGFARHRLAVDPLQEESHVAVIDLLGRLGRRREALAQYDACRRILEVELGVRPSPALEQVRRAAATAAPPRAERPAAPPLPTPVATTLVGRGREIDALEDVVGGIGARASNAVLQISGDPGIGKTRLLGELAAIARRAGGVVLAGRAFEAEMVRPYGAWIEALRSLPPEVPAPPEDMAPLLEERGSGAPPEWDRSRLFRAFTGYLAALASKHPAVAVLLDDVQWLDEASAALLHFAARELDGCRVLIACAARPAELADNRPVHAMLRELARQGRLRALDVEALDAAATRELVGAVDAALDADRVYHDAGGNPLFTLELARALKDGATSLPDSLSGLIVDRLLRIEGRARDVLPWAAALGSSFDLAIVAAATALPPVEVAAAFEELERHAVIRPAGARYDFTHDLVRQGAYRQVSEPRRRLMHLTLARALSASGDAALAGDVAHHAALGGDREAAARACVAAARRCVRLFASVDAAALAERGRELSQDLPRELRAPIQLELIEIIMEARSKEWTVPRFETEIERLVLDAQSAGLPAWVQQGFYLLSQLHFQAGDFRGAHHATMQSTAAIEASDPGSAARTLAKSARCLALLGREHALAASHLLRADRLSRQAGIDLPDIAWALGIVRHHEGRIDESVDLLERAHAAFSRIEYHWADVQCLAELASIDLEAGASDRVLARCDAIDPIARAMPEGSELAIAQALRALARLEKRDPGAPAAFESALGALRAVDTKAFLAFALAFAAESDLARGDVELARRRATEALEAATIVDRKTEIACARAVLAGVSVREGDTRLARAIIAPSLSEAPLLSARARHLLASVQPQIQPDQPPSPSAPGL